VGRNKKPEGEKVVQIKMNIYAEHYLLLRAAARRGKKSASAIIRDLIWKHLKRY